MTGSRFLFLNPLIVLIAFISFASLCKKPRAKVRQFRFIVLASISLFLPKVVGFSFPAGFIPYFDFSVDIGKNYSFDPPWVIVPDLDDLDLIYEGISLVPGIKYYLPRAPLTLQLSLSQGVPTIRVYNPNSEIYGSGSFGIIAYKNLRYELEIGGLYLRNFGFYRHSSFSGYLNCFIESRVIDFWGVIGLYRERHRIKDFVIKASDLFGGGGITFSKWYIRPQFTFALIHLFKATESNGWERPQKFSIFFTVGVTAQLGKRNIINLINKMTAPKSWSYFEGRHL